MEPRSMLESLSNFLAEKKGPFRYVTYIGSAALVAAFAYRYYSYVALPPEVQYVETKFPFHEPFSDSDYSCAPTEFNQRLLQKCSVLHETYYPTFW